MKVSLTLRRMLLCVSLLAVGLAWWARPTSVQRLLFQIHRVEYPHRGFDAAASVEPLERLMQRMPGEDCSPLQELLQHVSEEGFGKSTWFYGVEELVVENEYAVPGSTVFPYGYFCFAEATDGSRFAYCVHDRAVYQLGYITDGEYGLALTTTQIADNAWQRWESLETFLHWALRKAQADWE